VFTTDVFVGHTEWPTLNQTRCRLRDSGGRTVAYASFIGGLFRDPAAIMDEPKGRPLLQVQRPPGNLSLRVIHEGVPGTDSLYTVKDLEQQSLVGILDKPWLKGVWTDLWIVRDAEWAEVARVEQTSAARAWLRAFVGIIEGRYAVTAGSRRLGSVFVTRGPARRYVRVDLTSDPDRMLDRRLAVALTVVMLAVR
jgi:hypothetical protein